jgi:hypothetical protein
MSVLAGHVTWRDHERQCVGKWLKNHDAYLEGLEALAAPRMKTAGKPSKIPEILVKYQGSCSGHDD